MQMIQQFNRQRWCSGPEFQHEYSSCPEKLNVNMTNYDEDKTSPQNNVNAEAYSVYNKTTAKPNPFDSIVQLIPIFIHIEISTSFRMDS